jgi:hypothetical protein
MSKWKNFWIFIFGCITGALVVCSLIIASEIFFRVAGKREPSPPKVAGHKVPSEVYKVDFSKRYNLKLESYRGQHTYDNCLIKGFTYEEKEKSRGYSYFEKWLVVELPDKRLVYLQSGNIRVIEEAQQ